MTFTKLFCDVNSFTFKSQPFVPGEERDPYRVLGISRNSSEEQIREAYKTLVAKYHPDKVSHLGEEFKELAHKKFLAIQKAYNQITNKK